MIFRTKKIFSYDRYYINVILDYSNKRYKCNTLDGFQKFNKLVGEILQLECYIPIISLDAPLAIRVNTSDEKYVNEMLNSNIDKIKEMLDQFETYTMYSLPSNTDMKKLDMDTLKQNRINIGLAEIDGKRTNRYVLFINDNLDKKIKKIKMMILLKFSLADFKFNFDTFFYVNYLS